MLKRVWKKLVSPLIWIWDRPWPYWWYNTRTFPRDCVRGIKNLIVWFPIIWADRDWDWQFISDMLQFKLKRMSKAFREGGFAVDSDDNAEEMMEVWYHLRALEDDIPPRRLDGRPLTQEDYANWNKKLRDHQTKAFYIMGTRMRYWWD